MRHRTWGASALLHAPVDVVAGSRVVETGRVITMCRSAELVWRSPAAVEAVTLLFAAGPVDRRDVTEVSEGRFVAEPVGVVPGGDEQGGGGLDADADPGHGPGRSSSTSPSRMASMSVNLCFGRERPSGEGAQG